MSTDFNFEQPDEFGGGNFLNVTGTFHFAIDEAGTTDKEGKMIDGIRATFTVLDGTVRDKDGCTEAKKQTTITFFNGKLNHKDGGRFARQRQAALLVAAGVIGPEHIPAILAKKLGSVDLSKLRGKQVVMSVEKGEKYMDVVGAEIHHVDDPAVRAIPKNTKALELLPAALRRKPEELQAIKDAFGGKAPGASGSGNGNGSGGNAAGKQTQPALDLADL